MPMSAAPRLGVPEDPHERGLLPWFGRLWEAIRQVGRILWPMRFSLLLALVAGPFLMLPQSRDALLVLTEADGWIPQALFAGLVLLWAFYTHYWARFMSRLLKRDLGSGVNYSRATVQEPCAMKEGSRDFFDRDYGVIKNTSQAHRPGLELCPSLTFARYKKRFPYWSVRFDSL